MLISNEQGEAVAYAMFKLEDRGPMLIEPGWKVYKGMIVGEHTRDNDLEVNVLKGKQLTNIRATSKDEAVRLTPPIRMTLEQALAYIEDDELVEVTPKSIRLRKKHPRSERPQARGKDQGGGGVAASPCVPSAKSCMAGLVRGASRSMRSSAGIPDHRIAGDDSCTARSAP